MDIVMALLILLIVTGMTFVGSTFLAYVSLGIAGFAFPKVDRKRFAKAITAVPPVAMCCLAVFVLTDESQGGFVGDELSSSLVFGIGAFLALIASWPLSYRLARRLFGLNGSA